MRGAASLDFGSMSPPSENAKTMNCLAFHTMTGSAMIEIKGPFSQKITTSELVTCNRPALKGSDTTTVYGDPVVA